MGRKTLIHWTMRICKGVTTPTLYEKQEVYEVPYSGTYDARHMRNMLKGRLIPNKEEVSKLAEYVKEVLVEEWDKSLTIRVCVTKHLNDIIGDNHA